MTEHVVVLLEKPITDHPMGLIDESENVFFLKITQIVKKVMLTEEKGDKLHQFSKSKNIKNISPKD